MTHTKYQTNKDALIFSTCHPAGGLSIHELLKRTIPGQSNDAKVATSFNASDMSLSLKKISPKKISPHWINILKLYLPRRGIRLIAYFHLFSLFSASKTRPYPPLPMIFIGVKFDWNLRNFFYQKMMKIILWYECVFRHRELKFFNGIHSCFKGTFYPVKSLTSIMLFKLQFNFEIHPQWIMLQIKI